MPPTSPPPSLSPSERAGGEVPSKARGAAPALPPPPPKTDAARLWMAMDSGVGELERALSRFGQIVGGVGLLVSLYVALFVAHSTGLALSALSIATIAFYSSLHLAQSRFTRSELAAMGWWAPAVPWAAPAFEVVMPAIALWILGRTEGPEYALGSWVPPQLFSVFVAASILRLDARIPAAMGIAAAVTYGLVYAIALRGDLPAEPTLLYRPSMQIVRMGTLALIGGAASLAVVRVRAVIGAASVALRQTELFGKYRLGAELASGGMGRVLDATYCPEGGFERRVAVKLLHPQLAKDPGYVERFRTEAELGARLAHPNIVASLDFGKVGDTYFLAMEFVDGRTLQELLGERRKLGRPLPVRIVAWMGLQLAQGLEHAHVRATDDSGRILRVIHRDLSPSNVMIDRAGRVRIADFGVARALYDAQRLVTKNLVGKPAYVAPETLREQRVDEQSDLWSLGVVLWEALANERLFARDNEAASMLAVVEGKIPPPTQVRPGLSPHWDTLMVKLLDRDPNKRFRSASELLAALAPLAAAEGAVLPEDVREMLVREEGLEELALDDTSEEVLLPDEPGAGADGQRDPDLDVTGALSPPASVRPPEPAPAPAPAPIAPAVVPPAPAPTPPVPRVPPPPAPDPGLIASLDAHPIHPRDEGNELLPDPDTEDPPTTAETEELSAADAHARDLREPEAEPEAERAVEPVEPHPAPAEGDDAGNARPVVAAPPDPSLAPVDELVPADAAGGPPDAEPEGSGKRGRKGRSRAQAR